FAQEEGRDEIINDIESRIAELLHEKIRKGAAAITDQEVEEIALSMGRPEDFEAAETEGTESSQHSQAQQAQFAKSERKQKGRLYRDSSDKFIGGVCSGIAAYLNVDPAIVRILFAIITFGGFGLGFLLYILLWIVLPARDLEGYTGKRLYRNPDDKIIGGVAGGLAAYFNQKSNTIRLIFAAPLLFSILLAIVRGFTWQYEFDLFPNILFGSLSSTFILAYIVLWIVLPEAHTNYEKMEMRGEKVDANTIRKNVQEGMDNIKDRMKGWGEEVKESAQKLGSKASEFANTRGKTFATEVNESVRRSTGGLGHAIGVLFKVFFLFIAGSIAFGLFVALMVLVIGGVAWWGPVNDFLWTSNAQQVYAWGTVIFFFGVPLIGFITWLTRRILGVRSRHGYLGWTFGFLWTLGWIAGILLATSIAKDFRAYEHVDEPITIQQPANGRLIVAVSQPRLDYTGSFGWMDDDDEAGWDLSKDTLKLSTVRFDIDPSNDSMYHVTLKRYSYGKNGSEARERAESIQFSLRSMDSVLDLANGYGIGKDNKFRGQQVEVYIKVPIGKKIQFDQSVNDKLNPTNITIRRSYRRNRGVRVEVREDYWHQFRPGVDYIMGIDGNLRDVSGNAISPDVYRYKDQEEQPSIDEQRRKVEEEQERLRKMENDAKQKKESSTSFQENMDNTDDYPSSGNTTPVFCLVSWF
ncbi:MAG TPA: PspC domain-containing protein, partial [Chitinophagaceae bacterium]|nr:PspC domain-containing protein [Chitinophagaceae bacterium]